MVGYFGCRGHTQNVAGPTSNRSSPTVSRGVVARCGSLGSRRYTPDSCFVSVMDLVCTEIEEWGKRFVAQAGSIESFKQCQLVFRDLLRHGCTLVGVGQPGGETPTRRESDRGSSGVVAPASREFSDCP